MNIGIALFLALGAVLVGLALASLIPTALNWLFHRPNRYCRLRHGHSRHRYYFYRG
jgi:hypothetical protein